MVSPSRRVDEMKEQRNMAAEDLDRVKLNFEKLAEEFIANADYLYDCENTVKSSKKYGLHLRFSESIKRDLEAVQKLTRHSKNSICTGILISGLKILLQNPKSY
jgi:hypothetical protein